MKSRWISFVLLILICMCITCVQAEITDIQVVTDEKIYVGITNTGEAGVVRIALEISPSQGSSERLGATKYMKKGESGGVSFNYKLKPGVSYVLTGMDGVVIKSTGIEYDSSKSMEYPTPTPTPTPTPEPTHTPTPTPTPTPEPTHTPTPTPTPTPGFNLALAFIGLLSMTYILRKNEQ